MQGLFAFLALGVVAAWVVADVRRTRRERAGMTGAQRGADKRRVKRLAEECWPKL